MSRNQLELADYTSDKTQELQECEFTLDVGDLESTEVLESTAIRPRLRAQPPPPPPPRAATRAVYVYDPATDGAVRKSQPSEPRESYAPRESHAPRTVSGVYVVPELAVAQSEMVLHTLATANTENIRLRAQMRARDAYLTELERALEDHNRQLAAAGLDSFEDLAGLFGRVRGQAFRIAELESELRRTSAELTERVSPTTGEAGSSTSELRRVRGIGPRFAEQLATLGVSIEQIALWTEEDTSRIAAQLRISHARIIREAWVVQARALVGQ